MLFILLKLCRRSLTKAATNGEIENFMNRISILAYHEPGERETSKNASKNKNRNS
jgi:hypothetical protein